MNREILFRGKRIDNGEWVEGDLLQHDNGEQEIFVHKPCLFAGKSLEGRWYKVDPSSVGQYAGRTDKNDVKIFEGDICRCWMVDDEGQNEDVGLYVVKWNTDNAMFELEGDKENLEFGFLSECEVVGNIHDPEDGEQKEDAP